jgi:hypothetical protein
MRRQIAYALGMFLATAAPLHAVDLTGSWFVCEDCRIGDFCDPFAPPPPWPDTWEVTQTGTDLSVESTFLSQTLTGTIFNPATGGFGVSCCGHSYRFGGIGSFSTIDGTFDFSLTRGHIFGARTCNPMSPACDDGDSCTIDTCVNSTVGTCTATPVDVCINTQNGICATTTSSSTSTTTTSTLLAADQHPVTGTKLVLKKAASGRETLIFVTKDPTVYVPPFGGSDDPTIVKTQIELYSPPETSSSNEITVPSGVGKPGWQASPLPTPTYLFKNPTAPAGISKVKFIKLRAGKGLKIVARATGLSMTTPLGAVGIAVRLTPFSSGTPIICAHFGAASVKKDAPPVFTAGQSPAPMNCAPINLRQP